ncbi:MAG: hypothetical protein U5K76_03660 [Woeseiaceae bacterium]|nr:hypothetical protein [Woeseiaceae bacterium]
MNKNVNYLSPVADASVEDRSQFIWKCYAHVVGAILAFAAVEAYLFRQASPHALQSRCSTTGCWSSAA